MKTKLLSLILLTSLLFVACSPSGAQPTEVAAVQPVIADTSIMSEGRIEPVRFAEIAFTASGVISEVLVQEGESVKKGQPLIRLGDNSDTNYAAAQLELVNAQQALDDLLETEDQARAQALIALDEAEEAVDKAQDYYESLFKPYKYYRIAYKYVYLPGKTKRIPILKKVKVEKGDDEVIADAEADLALKLAELEEAQRAYERVKDGPDTDQLAVLETRLDASKAGVAAFVVIAPFDGVVAELNAKAGNSIKAGEVAVTVADFSSWLIETTDLTEIDVVTLTDEQPVVVTLDAIPDATLNGVIKSIGQTYQEKQGDIVYTVRVALEDSHPSLRWGMTAVVQFGD